MEADAEAVVASEDSLAPTEEAPQLESANTEESDDTNQNADDGPVADDDDEEEEDDDDDEELEGTPPEVEQEAVNHTEDSNHEEPSNMEEDNPETDEEEAAQDGEYDDDGAENEVEEEAEGEEDALDNLETNAGLEEEEEADEDDDDDDENEGDELEETNEEKSEDLSEPVNEDSAEMEMDTSKVEDNGSLTEQVDLIVTRKRTASLSSTDDAPRRKVGRSASNASGDSTHDKYCWVCHKEGVFFQCKICPRSYHARCMSLPDAESSNAEGDGTANKTCICPECVVVMNAENIDSRSEAMKMLNMDQLMSMLKSICARMRITPGAEPFLTPVLATDAADYYEYIIYPMDIFTLEKNIKLRQYGSTEAFLADAQWLVHNSIVFNSSSSPYTAAAKRLLKICKQELSEIETCPECYANAHTKTDTWFIEACKRPHILVWAKLKGFPFWPAKAMKIKDDQVDVRFFGQHDRAWVSMKDCFYYSEEMPASPPKKNGPLLSAIEELTAHVDKLKEMYGRVIFQSVRTPLGSSLSLENIQRMLPDFEPEEPSQHRTSVQVNPKQKAQLSAKQGKSPVTITISSLKTNPTIVSNSVNDGSLKLGIKSKKVSTGDSSSPSPSKAEEAKIEEEKNDEKGDTVLPKESKAEEVKETPREEAPEVDLRPPSGEILANALGLRRIVRKPSKEDNLQEGENSGEGKTGADVQESHVEKRLNRGLRSAVADDDSNSRETAPAEGIVLRKSLRVSSKESKDKEAPVVIKGEPPDIVDEDPEDAEERNGSNATKAFMEQLTSQGHNKPGYRFNISKDISISAVGESAESNKSSKIINTSTGAGKVRRPNVGIGNINPRGPPIILPQGMQVQVTGQNVSAAAGASNKPRLVPTASQRFIMKDGQIRPVPRQGTRIVTGNIRPGNIRMNSTNQRQMGGMQVRHSSMQNLKGNREKDNAHHPIVVDSTSLRIDNQGSTGHYSTANAAGNSAVASAIQVNQVQSLQGAITLPGGTITVTPLSTLLASGVSNISAYTTANSVNVNGGSNALVTLKSNASNSSNIGLLNVHSNSGTTTVNANGLPISFVTQDNPSITATPINSMAKNKNQMGQQRRNISITLPPSVGVQMQNFTKNVTELVKSTVEQIAVDIIENGTGSKADLKAMQQEIEKIQIKYSKEIVDMKHNHDIAMRELRVSLENDKKRCISEIKRHLEQEKQKAIDEAKKKQWCANCGREALFYCCWNTSYCGYSCQENHWPSHMSTCTQNNAGATR